MIAIYFIYGLSFFSLGLAVLLEMRHTSELPLSKQLGWLAAFGFVHSLVEWIDMFGLIDSSGTFHDALIRGDELIGVGRCADTPWIPTAIGLMQRSQ